ncbi:hypothetical protein GWI33_005491 [Rhynchophorus ferrugineus]|uniref:Uncharacterized protein n=1 Tax=Rhynchophorus ferrugineus TaxID=354439 RepID=A0A834ILL5_RHYFE|nr:hypothetical protein GWI33_005491 [Rhynchophorus ferrugineus]
MDTTTTRSPTRDHLHSHEGYFQDHDDDSFAPGDGVAGTLRSSTFATNWPGARFTNSPCEFVGPRGGTSPTPPRRRTAHPARCRAPGTRTRQRAPLAAVNANALTLMGLNFAVGQRLEGV